LWYDRLAAGRPDGDPRRVRVVATAPSCEPSQDAARSRAEDSGEWVTNVVAHRWRCDSLPLEPSGADRDRDDRRHAQTLPGLMAAAIRATKEHQRRAGWPSADLHLPKISESVVGQLLQMLMLATAVEERLHAGPPADLTTPQRLY
jgi:glucose-6-phosphate isomerase